MIYLYEKINIFKKNKIFFFNLNFLKIFFFWKKYLSTQDLIDLFKLSLKPKKLIKIPLEKIYFFHDQINFKIDKRYFKNNILKVSYSPQVKFLKSKDKFSKTKIYNSKIFKFYMNKKSKINFFDKKIIKINPTVERTLNKIDRLIIIFNSIKKHGYLRGRFSKCYPCVIKNGYNYNINNKILKVPGYEIFIGHRRLSSLSALGKKQVKVIELEKL